MSALRNRLLLAGAIAVAGGIAAVKTVGQERRVPAQRACVRGTFPDYLDQAAGWAPEGWTGPTFKLAQDYPESLPPAERYPWLAVKVTNGTIGDPDAYIRAVKQYVLEGNIVPDKVFVVQENKLRKWYHLPWMHWGPTGREFVHGLTHEIDSPPGYLDTKHQTHMAATWAVSLINDRGAWSIGRVWCDPQRPAPNRINANPNGLNTFPDGTAEVKLLFTTGTPTEIPWLRGTLAWQADVNRAGQPVRPNGQACSTANACALGQTCNLGTCFGSRAVSAVYLVQVDIAVRDTRLSATGWAFGTFAYNAAVRGSTVWDRLIPIGLMWGNDPGVTPEMVRNGTVLKESWSNPAADPLNDNGMFGGGNHLGYAGRVNGPADDVQSSCLSCHGVSGVGQAPEGSRVPFTAPIVPEAVDPDMPVARRMAWFANVPAGVPFSYDITDSLDYQLQTALGITRFYLAQAATPGEAFQRFKVARGHPREPAANRPPSSDK